MKRTRASQIVWLIKVGSDERPAGPEDIEQTKKLFEDSYKNKDKYIVTHHALSFEAIEKKVLKDHLLVVQVGSDVCPAGPKDIQSAELAIEKALKDNKTHVVTHHAIKIHYLKR